MIGEYTPSKVLFYMPHETQYFLPALAAVQSYLALVVERLAEKVNCTPPVVHIVADAVHHYLLKTLTKTTVIPSDNYDFVPKRGIYDLVFHFEDIDSFYEIATPTMTHISRMYGLLMGSIPETIPDLTAIRSDAVGVGFGLLECDWYGQLLIDLEETYNAPMKLLDFVDQITERQFRIIESCRMLIGPQSSATYVAAALGKLVVELVPGTRYPRWLSKFSCPGYFMLYGEVTLEQILKGVDTLWVNQAETLSSMNTISYGQGIPTEHTMSAAECADE